MSKTTGLFRGSPGTKTPSLLFAMTQVEEETFRNEAPSRHSLGSHSIGVRGHLSIALGLTIFMTYFLIIAN